MNALQLILLLALLMLGLMAFWPVAVTLLMTPLKGFMDERIWSYLTLVLPFALTVLSVIIVHKAIFKKSFRALLWEEGERRTERKTAATVFIVLLSVFLLSNLFSETVEATDYTALQCFLSLTISIVFIPLQVLSEELMFRVIPARMFFPEGFGKKKWLDALFVLLSGAAFALMHARNPEVMTSEIKWLLISNYFLSGACLSLFAVLTNGFLVGLAYHTAINLYVSVFVNTTNGVIPSYSFFLERTEGFESTSMLSTVMASLITIAIIFLIKERDKEKHNGKKEKKRKEEETLLP